jgi:hypothetical protein
VYADKKFKMAAHVNNFNIGPYTENILEVLLSERYRLR